MDRTANAICMPTATQLTNHSSIFTVPKRLYVSICFSKLAFSETRCSKGVGLDRYMTNKECRLSRSGKRALSTNYPLRDL